MKRQPTRWAFLGVTLALTFLFISDASAERAILTMGEYVRETELIIVADTVPKGLGLRETVLRVREIIKGDRKLLDERLVLSERDFNTSDPRVPGGVQNVAVLLSKGWESGRHPIVEVYTKQTEIEALRVLSKIYELPTERARLVSLRDLVDNQNLVYRQQLFADLYGMLDSDNFDLVIELARNKNAEVQKKAIEFIGRVGDVRGITPLLATLESPDARIRYIAAWTLDGYFPGAAGVTEAFRKALRQCRLQDDDLRKVLSDYLALRDPTILQKQPTLYQQASRLTDAGERETAKPIWLKILEDERESDSACRRAAELVADGLKAEERVRVRKALLSLMARDARGDNWLDVKWAAKTLRAVANQDCEGPLLDVLKKEESSIHEESAQFATMGLVELGPAAREKAMTLLLERLKRRMQSKGGRVISESEYHYAQLAWLTDEAGTAKIEALLDDTERPLWLPYRQLVGVANREDEGKFLIELLKSGKRLPHAMANWIVFRLGDLRDRRAVNVVVKDLKRDEYFGGNYGTSNALKRIGGPDVVSGVTELLRDKGEWVRGQAIEILCDLQGKDAVPLLRRMLMEKDFGLKDSAALYLGRLGAPEDLPLLLPLTDFWKKDRSVHFWAMSSIAEIRRRHHYDMNGPIHATAP